MENTLCFRFDCNNIVSIVLDLVQLVESCILLDCEGSTIVEFDRVWAVLD